MSLPIQLRGVDVAVIFLVSLTVQAGLIFRKTDRKKVQPHGKSKPPKLA